MIYNSYSTGGQGFMAVSKQTSSSGYALRLSLFTTINPWYLCYNYNKNILFVLLLAHFSPTFSRLFPPSLMCGMTTVEPRLISDTPQQRTPMIQRTIPKVPTVLPLTSILKQPLNSGHPATPYNRQFSQFQL